MICGEVVMVLVTVAGAGSVDLVVVSAVDVSVVFPSFPPQEEKRNNAAAKNSFPVNLDLFIDNYFNDE
jgi:hypothetical protein